MIIGEFSLNVFVTTLPLNAQKKVLLKILFKNAILELNGASWRRFLLWRELWEKINLKRKKYRDVNREVIDRLEYALRRNDISILWHSNYYAQSTSKEERERLQQKCLEHADEWKEDNEAPASSYTTRSQAMDNTSLVVSVKSLPFLPEQNTSPRHMSVQ